MKKHLSSAVALLLFVLCIHADAARVTLRDGRVFDGKILGRTNDSVVIEDASGVKSEIPNSIIENIEDDSGFEPERARMPELVIQNGHAAQVKTLAFSPDGRLIASGSFDYTIKLWNARTGELVRTIQGHADRVESVVFSPDSRMMASAGDDGNVRLWSVETGAQIRAIKAHGGRANAVAFSPDAGILASGGDDNAVKLWSVETGALLRTLNGHTGFVASLAYSPDGATVASGGWDNTIRVWSADTGETVFLLKGHRFPVLGLVFRPDGEVLASSSMDSSIKLWSASTGRIERTIRGHRLSATAIAFSPDGRTLASGNEAGRADLWDADTGAAIRSMAQHGNRVDAVAFNPDGTALATGSKDKTVKLWSLDTGALLYSLEGRAGYVTSIAFAPGRVMPAAGSWDGSVMMWPPDAGAGMRSLHGHKDRVSTVAFSPDGSQIASASGDGAILIRDAVSGQTLHEIATQSGRGHTIAYSPDGAWIASAGDAGALTLFDARTGANVRSFEKLSGNIYAVAFSPDGDVLASGGNDNTIKLWSTGTGNLLRTLKAHAEPVIALAFSADGQFIASGGEDKTARLWDARTGAPRNTIDAHTGRVSCVAFSPDGLMLATGSDDQTVRLWDARTAAPLRTLEGHTGRVNAVAFSPDGRVLASGSGDTTMKLWNPDTGALLATITGFSDGNWFVQDSAGRFDCSNCAQGGGNSGKRHIRWRVGERLYEPDQFFRGFWAPNLLAGVLRAGRVAPVESLGDVMAGLPPEVDIRWPRGSFETPYTTGSDSLQIIVTVRDIGGGAEHVRLFNQGRPAGGEVRDITTAAAPAGTKKFAVTVELSSGINRIVAQASSRTGIDSREGEAEVYVRSAIAEENPSELYLLTVGINEYKNAGSNLAMAATDADDFESALKNGGASLFANIHATRLRNAEATRDNIRAALENIRASAGINDMVIVYFSGHGAATPAGWFFMPHEITQWDNKYIADNAFSDLELRAFLENLKSRKVILVLDSCQSGEMVFNMRSVDQKALVELGRSMGVYIFAASTDAQYAFEDKGLGHGVFTYALLQGLNGAADGAGGEKSGSIEAEELKNFIRGQVPELMKKLYGVEQYPVTYGVSYGGLGGLGPTLVALPKFFRTTID